MLETLGIKRLAILGALAALAGLLAASYYLYIVPEQESAERQLRKLEGQVSTKRSDIAKIQVELEKLVEQKDTFEELRDKGYFSEQNRVVARNRIEEIQDLSAVLSVRYRIEPADIETNELIEKANHVILSSPFEVNIDALDDTDIYRFFYLLQTSFPGHASFEQIELERGTEVNDASLRKILTGEPVPLVRGKIRFTWRTFLPEESVGFRGQQ